MEIIAVLLCVLLLATVGVSAAGTQEKLPPQYRVVQFDVTYKDEVVGKLSVNTNEWTYVLNAHGLEPYTKYYFYCLGQFPQINTGNANENGDLHMQGEWDPQKVNFADSLSTPEFILSASPLFGGNCIIPQLTAKAHAGIFKTTVWGTLTDPSGNPLPYQTLRVDGYDKWKKTWMTWYWVETDVDGTFKQIKAGSPDSIIVTYEGGEFNGTTYCSTWVHASESVAIPL